MTFACLALLLFAIPPSNAWAEVIALPAGTEIRMRIEAGTFEGTFVSATTRGITVRIGREEHAIIESSIRRIDRRLPGSNRARNIGRGLLVGAGIGALRILTRKDAGGSLLFAGPFMLVGTVAGAASPEARWETVYKTVK